MITTDRVSAFDHVLGTIPFKGEVLSRLTAFWFEKVKDIAPTHLLDVPDPSVMVVKQAKPLPDRDRDPRLHHRLALARLRGGQGGRVRDRLAEGAPEGPAVRRGDHHALDQGRVRQARRADQRAGDPRAGARRPRGLAGGDRGRAAALRARPGVGAEPRPHPRRHEVRDGDRRTAEARRHRRDPHARQLALLGGARATRSASRRASTRRCSTRRTSGSGSSRSTGSPATASRRRSPTRSG